MIIIEVKSSTKLYSVTEKAVGCSNRMCFVVVQCSGLCFVVIQCSGLCFVAVL